MFQLISLFLQTKAVTGGGGGKGAAPPKPKFWGQTPPPPRILKGVKKCREHMEKPGDPITDNNPIFEAATDKTA